MAPSLGGNAAVAVAAQRPDGRGGDPVFHVDPQPERSIQAMTEDLIVDLCQRFQVLEVHAPEGGHIRTFQLLEDRGVPVVSAHPSPSRLVAASGTFDRLLFERKLIHDGDPTTRSQILRRLRRRPRRVSGTCPGTRRGRSERWRWRSTPPRRTRRPRTSVPPRRRLNEPFQRFLEWDDREARGDFDMEVLAKGAPGRDDRREHCLTDSREGRHCGSRQSCAPRSWLLSNPLIRSGRATRTACRSFLRTAKL